MSPIHRAAILVIALPLCSCKPHDPVFPTDVDLNASSPTNPLMPRGLTMDYNDQLLKGRVSATPDMSQLTTLAIRNIPRKAFKMAKGSQWKRIPDALFVPEQAEELNLMLEVLKPLIDESISLNELMSERFSDQLRDMAAAAGGGSMANPEQIVEALVEHVQTALSDAEITMEEEDFAIMDVQFDLAKLPIPQAGAAGDQGPLEFGIPFVRLENGNWRIEVPFFPEAEVLAQARSSIEGQMQGILQQIGQVRSEIEAGTLASPELVGQRLMMTNMGLMGAIMPIVQSVQAAIAEEAAALAAEAASEGTEEGDVAPEEGTADEAAVDADDADAGQPAEPPD